MISESEAVGSPMSIQWMVSHPDRTNTKPHPGDRFMSIKILTGALA